MSASVPKCLVFIENLSIGASTPLLRRVGMLNPLAIERTIGMYLRRGVQAPLLCGPGWVDEDGGLWG